MVAIDIIKDRKNRKDKKEIQKNSKEILKFLSVQLGERTLRKYKNLNDAKNFIISYLEDFGAEVKEDIYKVNGKEVSNIVAEVRGTENPEKIILLGGHYDTVEDTSGADDNGTAIVALLEIFRIFSKLKLKKTVRFVAFTLEEPPFFLTDEMGSMHYAKKCKENNEEIELAVIMDMLGYSCKRCIQEYPVMDSRYVYPKHGDFLVAITFSSLSKYAYSWKRTWNGFTNHRMETLVGPASIPGIDLSDHTSFKRNGFPAILLTDTAYYRNKNYHMPTDTYDTINFSFLTENIFNISLTLQEFANRDIENLISGL